MLYCLVFTVWKLLMKIFLKTISVIFCGVYSWYFSSLSYQRLHSFLGLIFKCVSYWIRIKKWSLVSLVQVTVVNGVDVAKNRRLKMNFSAIWCSFTCWNLTTVTNFFFEAWKWELYYLINFTMKNLCTAGSLGITSCCGTRQAGISLLLPLSIWNMVSFLLDIYSVIWRDSFIPATHVNLPSPSILLMKSVKDTSSITLIIAPSPSQSAAWNYLKRWLLLA